MKEKRIKERAMENDTSGFERSFDMIKQFNMLKKICSN